MIWAACRFSSARALSTRNSTARHLISTQVGQSRFTLPTPRFAVIALRQGSLARRLLPCREATPREGPASNRPHAGSNVMAGHGIGGRYVIELPSTTGRMVSLEFRVRLDSVEAWYQERCQAVMDRDLFRYWLDENPTAYVVDDLMWTRDDADEVILVIPGLGCWLIPASLMAGLRDLV
jgi:hypothetical protein